MDSKAETDALKRSLDTEKDRVTRMQTDLESMNQDDPELARRLDVVTTEGEELRKKIETLEADLEGARKENHELKTELDAFDPSFFEELEDLKFNFDQAVRKNQEYEDRFGGLNE